MSHLVLHLLFSTPQASHETAAERAKRITNKRVQLILASMDNASLSPSEFLSLIEGPAPASRQKSEDNAFIRLYRGYAAQDITDWVNYPPPSPFFPSPMMTIQLTYASQIDALKPYSVPVQSYRTQVNMTRGFESETLDNRLVSRDAVCSSYCSTSSIVLIRQLSLLFQVITAFPPTHFCTNY